MAKRFQVDTGGTLTTNLISYWKLSDVNDFFASNNLTNTNSVAFNAGKVGNAADAGASNSTKDLTVASALGINGGTISIAAWINVTTAPGTNVFEVAVAQSAGTSQVRYSIIYNDSAGTKQLRFRRRKSAVGDQQLTSAQTLTAGTWYHVVFTYDGVNIEGWLNGSSLGTAAASGSGSAGATDHFSIFREGDGDSDYFSGLVDEVGVWSKKLSSTEIGDLYNAGNGQTMVDTLLSDKMLLVF